jgi:glucose-6-phosphate isomerase
MPDIKLDVNNMLAQRLGSSQGITEAMLAGAETEALRALSKVQEVRGTGWLEWTQLPYQDDSAISDIENTAQKIKEKFDSFVLLGIGGSALGPACVHEALHPLRSNENKYVKTPNVYFEDNVDPERMAALLEIIDPAKTCFNVITKSGGTAETMSQYLIVRDLIKDIPNWRENIIVTTSQGRGSLYEIAKLEGFKTFIVPDGVGGRFSELSPVGLLAAAVSGINIREMLKGAARMDERCKVSDIYKNPALLYSVLEYIAMTRLGRNIQVLMPYADSLRLLSDWFCQLWAESLGKSVTRSGKIINAGQTPVKALGVTDQHSQLQLYTEGPFDKVITLMQVENYRVETKIPTAPENYPDEIRFLGGKTHSQLIKAEKQGTEYALTSAGRMNQTIIVPVVDEDAVGQLLYFFEMATAITGELLDIDAFNQPGVEGSKIATYATLNHPAEKYEKARKEMSGAPDKEDKYII